MRLTPRNHWRDNGRYIINTFWGEWEVDAFTYYQFKAFMFFVFVGHPLVWVSIGLYMLYEALQ